MAKRPTMTREQFLALEVPSATRHEYVRGEMFAMTGASTAHNDIVTNVTTLLKRHLRGGPCRVYCLDVKLSVEEANAVFYPDIFITCDPRDRDDPLVQRYAKLVVEVLSPSTAEYDRDEKFTDYRALASLQEYVLIDSRVRHAVAYRRTDRGVWEFAPATADGELGFAAIGLTAKVAAFYEDTDVPATRAKLPMLP